MEMQNLVCLLLQLDNGIMLREALKFTLDGHQKKKTRIYIDDKKSTKYLKGLPCFALAIIFFH